jgi:thiamine pyrophosphokinase
MCADGGTNRLYDDLGSMLGLAGGDGSAAALEAARAAHIPNVIIGDLDSLRAVSNAAGWKDGQEVSVI